MKIPLHRHFSVPVHVFFRTAEEFLSLPLSLDGAPARAENEQTGDNPEDHENIVQNPVSQTPFAPRAGIRVRTSLESLFLDFFESTILLQCGTEQTLPESDQRDQAASLREGPGCPRDNDAILKVDFAIEAEGPNLRVFLRKTQSVLVDPDLNVCGRGSLIPSHEHVVEPVHVFVPLNQAE